MEVEIVFSGLCSFLNLRDCNPTMPEPSVILVQTSDKLPGDHGGHGTATGKHKHIPYIAFDARRVAVDDDTGFQALKDFRFLPLTAYEIEIEKDPPTEGKLRVHSSYDTVVRKDDYWPQAKNKWNTSYVPKRGKKPKKKAVAAFLRFGSGQIRVDRRAVQDWKFKLPGGGVHQGRFAEEVIYHDFPHSRGSVVLTLRNLKGGKAERTLTFRRIGVRWPLTILIGNHHKKDLLQAFTRKSLPTKKKGHHFAFLNLVAKTQGGPIAEPVQPRTRNGGNSGGGPSTGGGLSSGPCGPNNGNR